MSYSYATERPYVFTEDGQVDLLLVVRKARECIAAAGVVRCDKLMGAGLRTGESWQRLAIVDRLVELEMLRDVTIGAALMSQRHVYIEGRVPL